MTINGDGVPANGRETCSVIFRLGEVSHFVQGHIVGIVDDDQVVQTIVTSVRSSFERNTFLQATITAQSNHVVIKDGVTGGVVFGSGQFGSSSHTNSVTNTGTKRTSGSFDDGGVVFRGRDFRVTRCHGVVTTEVFDLFKGKSITGQV